MEENISKKELLKELKRYEKEQNRCLKMKDDIIFFKNIMESVVEIVNAIPVDKKKITTY